MESLNQKLNAALADVAALSRTHGTVALAVEENEVGAGAERLKDAADALEAAEKRVVALRSAITAAEAREVQRRAEEAAEAERLQKAALAGVLDELAAEAAGFDAVLDSLVECAGRVKATLDKLHIVHADAATIRQADQMRNFALSTIEQRLVVLLDRNSIRPFPAMNHSVVGWGRTLSALLPTR